MIMKIMRQKFHLWVFWLLTVVLAVGLVLPGIQMAGNRDAVAVVAGDPIKLARFDKLVSRALEQERAYAGGELSEQDSTRIRRELLEQLIEEELALHGLKKLGLSLPEDELRQTLASDPTFRDEKGVFSPERYQRFLQAQAERGLGVDETEDMIRRGVAVAKAKTLFANNARVSPAEIEQGLKKAQRLVQIKALVWDYKALGAAIKPSDEDLHSYYSRNRMRWAKTPQIKVRHILVKTDSLIGTATARAKADLLYSRAKAGEDFATLAKENSQDEGSAARGGDLGTVSKGEMVPEFEASAFKLKAGQVGEPVLSKFGWHVIKVDSKTEGFEPTFENSKAKALEGFQEESAAKQARQSALRAAKDLAAGAKLEEIAKKEPKAALKTSGWIKAGDKAVFQGLSDTAGLADAVIELEKGEHLSSPYPLGKGIVLAELAAEKAGTAPKDPLALNESRAKVAARLRNQKATALYQGWLLALRSELKVDNRYEKFYGMK